MRDPIQSPEPAEPRPAAVPPHVTAEDYAEVLQGRADALDEAAAEERDYVTSVTDLVADGVPVRLYVPAGPKGTLLYLHGGGFVFGCIATHDAFMRRLANRTGWAVLGVDYRLAPEHPYPAAPEDTERVAAWWHEHALDHGLRAEDTVPIGDSAGAALALGLTVAHPERYPRQILVYPFLDPSCASYDDTLVDPDLDLEACHWFWSLYAPDAARHAEVALDPARAESYVGLPETLVQFAEHDVLVPTGHALVRRLANDGVAVTVQTYPGVGHGFWRRRDNDQGEVALRDIDAFLNPS